MNLVLGKNSEHFQYKQLLDLRQVSTIIYFVVKNKAVFFYYYFRKLYL